MTKERIEKAVEIIHFAIKNKISVREASVKCGYANTYVKNVKREIYEAHDNGVLKEGLLASFNEAYDEYKYYRGFGLFEDEKNDKIKYSENQKQISNLPSTINGEQTTINGNDKTAEIEWKSGANYPPDHIRTLDQLLKICEVDLNVWNVKDYLINKWDTTSWKNNSPETIQNFQVKARLEKNIKYDEVKDIREIFADMAQTYKPPILKVVPKLQKNSDENNLLEISIFDLHYGKLCCNLETGEDYDIKIARKRFLGAIETLLRHASGFPITRILFPVGNDFFNSDNMFNTTTKGTPVDEDIRWQKTFATGVKLLVDGINLLKQMQVPVDVIVIPGNHDSEKSYYMGSYLEAWFNGDEQVCINNSALTRKYFKFGKVLLGFTHGSEEKENSLPLLMASDSESKLYWSDTLYHEWHLGHVHRKKDVKFTVLDKAKTLSEDLGVTVRYLSSLTGTDSWHFKKAFIGQIKAADAFIWNDKAGLIAHLNSNLIIE